MAVTNIERRMISTCFVNEALDSYASETWQ